MGVGVIVAVASVVISAAMAAYAIMSKPEGNQDEAGPAGLDQFGVTQTREGMVVRIIIGRVRIPSNLIYYGGLKTEEIFVKPPGGGKGSKPKKQSSGGYRYYLDVWHSLCMGKITIIKVLVQDKEEVIEAANTIFNDGTMSTYPTFLPTFNALPGIAHVSYEKWFMGDNSTSVPTLHFVVERVLEYPALPHQNLPNGSNPAAAAYDLHKMSGTPDSELNLQSFIDTSYYWEAKGYGLNFSIDKVNDVYKLIESILNDVDGVHYKNNEGRWTIRPLDPLDAVVMTIHQDVLSDFSFNRKTWSQVKNFFNGTFLEEDSNFASRAVRTYNPAAIRLAGVKIPFNVDLKKFRDLTTASKRLFELAKRNSYPAASIQGKTNQAASTLLPGDVIELQYPDYGIISAKFRITEIDTSSIEKNDISFSAAQMVETLFDDVFDIAGGSDWEEPDLALVPLTHIRIFELPYNSTTGFDPAFLILAAREKLVETSCQVLMSVNATQDYSLLSEMSTFSQYGTLDQEYGNTLRIDETGGIYFTAFKDDPGFDTISEADLFSLPRFAIIGDEMITFREVIALGGNQFRLLGCVRGLIETPISVHPAGSDIWLVNFGSNVLSNPNFESFYVKLVPLFLREFVDPADVTPISVSTTYKAKHPRTPTWVTAERTGGDVAVQIYPTTPGIPGAGSLFPSAPSSNPPFPIGDSVFVTQIDSEAEIIRNTTTFIISRGGSFALLVKSRLHGFVSAAETVAVGAGDGKYYS